MPGEIQTSEPNPGRPPVTSGRRSSRWLTRAVQGTLLALTLATPAGATLLEPMTLDDLAGRADVVLHGRVASVRTISHGPNRMPVTLAQIEVLEVLAGDLPPRRQIMVTQPGGSAGGVSLEYAGRPQFVSGQEVVLFLVRRTPGQFITLGLAQGKFDMGDDDGHGRRRLSRNMHGAAFATPATGSLPEDLGDLRRRLHALPRDLTGVQP
jgi:hypothetical protein